MSNLLLTTKFNCPKPRRNLVTRGRLLEQLNTGLWREDEFLRKLTLVSAPAGYGKTTLVADWLSQVREEQGLQAKGLPPEKKPGALETTQTPQIAWLSLDEGENDPVRFILYLITCLANVDQTIQAVDDALIQPTQASSLDSILTRLINQLVGVENPIILALDDYHVISNPTIHHHLTFLLDHLPPCIHLVIMTREDPLLPIARLRASREVQEVRQEQLRFTRAEIEQLLIKGMGLPLQPGEMDALERRTEGWVVGLQLAALSMQRREDLSTFIQAFTGSSRFILDYLVEEVFERQTPEIQGFLLKTSILERLSPSLCDSLVQDNNSHQILESLEQNNLFIVAQDQSRTWYRYHRLFSELLKHRLRTTQPDLENKLHLAASQWFEVEGMIDQAIQHAKAARDWDRAGDLIQGSLTEYLKRGEALTIINWLESFPEEVMGSNPRLMIDKCWPLLIIGHYEKAEPILDALEPMASNHPLFLGEVYAAQAYLARGLGDHLRMVDRSQRALEYLAKDSLVSRSVVTLNLGLAYWHSGQMEEAAEALSEAYQTAKATDNLYALLTAIIFQGRVHAVRGQLHQAAEYFTNAIQQGQDIPILALAYMDLATLQYEWNLFDQSEANLRKAISLCQDSQNDEFLVGCLILKARLQIAQGEYQGAKDSLLEADLLVKQSKIPDPMAKRVDAAWGFFSAQAGDCAPPTVRDIPEQFDSHSFYRFIGVTRARTMPIPEARDYLAELGIQAKGNGWTYALVAILALQAINAETQHIGLGYLNEALRLGENGGFIRSFLEAGGKISSLLREAIRTGHSPTYARAILAASKDQGLVGVPALDSMIEPLTEREIEVLQLVTQGMSNREIAVELVISTGTAKSHVHNLCGKLGVRNRTEAAMRAKELGLV